MDFSKCHCPKPGMCNIFNKIMTEVPPNWQWCQNATPEEREKYKQTSDAGVQTRLKKFPSGDIIQVVDLIDCAINKLTPKVLRKHKIFGIVGIPRSGLIPAAYVAEALDLPLYSLAQHKSSNTNKVILLKRSSGNNASVGKLLFLDDTSSSGRSSENLKKSFPNHIISSVFSTSKALPNLDYCGKILDGPHILSWNFFNSHHIKNTAFDLDGVFCPNVPLDVCKDDDKYTNYLANVQSYHYRMPKVVKAKAVITGRLEKYRNLTEAWLKKNDVNYDKLIMFPNELRAERDKNHQQIVGRYKAENIKLLNANFFVESEMSEAKVIKRENEFVTVVCPNNGVYF